MKAIPALPPGAQLEDLRRYVEDMFKIMNNISLGDGTNRSDGQNTDTIFLTGTSNAIANTETVFDHVLARVPVGFIIVKMDKAGRFYTGATAWSSTKIALKCDVASVAFTAILF